MDTTLKRALIMSGVMMMLGLATLLPLLLGSCCRNNQGQQPNNNVEYNAGTDLQVTKFQYWTVAPLTVLDFDHNGYHYTVANTSHGLILLDKQPLAATADEK